MVAVTHAAHEIEAAAESLQKDLARLDAQKQALERELTAVSAHLDSVQRALGALRTVMAAGPGPEQDTPTPDGNSAQVPDSPAAPDGSGPDGQRKYGRLTEQILDYFAETGDSDVRARDVAEALGRATDSGSINAVRSTLDRLVGTSRIRRAGRGLYRAG